MNSKIVAAALATAFVASAAQAGSITTYAQVQFEVSDVNRDNSVNDTVRVTDNQRGRFGIKGGHKLSKGLKSFAIIEMDLVGGNSDTETKGTGTGIREVNAGIKGAFGSIALGTVKSAYKYSGGVKYDPYTATQLEQRGRAGMSKGTVGHNSFLDNAFVYKKKLGITMIHATYSLDDTDRDNDGEKDGGALSVGATVGKKKWQAGGAYANARLSGTNNNSAIKVFGKMKFNRHTILGQIEDVDTSDTESSTYIMIGYQLKLGKGMFSAYIGDRNSNDATKDAENITIAYMHKFNKKSRVFAGIQTYDQTGSGSDRDTLTAGVRIDL